jgi:hypothetical protein
MNGRPGKGSMSPIQREILLLIEEAGEETIITVLATLQHQFPTYTPEELLVETEKAVNGLKRLGLLVVTEWHSELHRTLAAPHSSIVSCANICMSPAQ